MVSPRGATREAAGRRLSRPQSEMVLVAALGRRRTAVRWPLQPEGVAALYLSLDWADGHRRGEPGVRLSHPAADDRVVRDRLHGYRRSDLGGGARPTSDQQQSHGLRMATARRHVDAGGVVAYRGTDDRGWAAGIIVPSFAEGADPDAKNIVLWAGRRISPIASASLMPSGACREPMRHGAAELVAGIRHKRDV